MKKRFVVLLLVTITVAGILYFVGRKPPAPPLRAVNPRIAAPSHPVAIGGPLTGVDLVLVEKRARRLSLFRRGVLLKTYRVALGKTPVGKKTTEGDGKTPEGCYVIDRRNANSRYHRALHISYPNADDLRQAMMRCVSPGRDVMIHGLPNKFANVGALHVTRDWTLGCIALTNDEIDEVWRAVPNGTAVKIVP